MPYDVTNSTFMDQSSKLLKNHNYINPTSFRVDIDGSVASNVSYTVQQVMLPDISVDVANYATPKINLGVHADKVTYGIMDFTFLVDEYMINYKEIHDWLLAQINEDDSTVKKTRDITLTVLASNGSVARTIKFINAFPINISPLSFDSTATDVEYIVANVSFRYTYFKLD